MLKTDAQRMKEAIAKAINVELDEEIRENALDELEMYVESIDNANDLATIQGIPPMLSLLNDASATIQLHAAWVLGTSSQSNARFSEALFKAGGLEALLTALRQTTNVSVLSRIVYALSSAIRASQSAVEAAVAQNAFESLVQLFKTCDDLNIKRKLAFFFGGIIFEQPHVEQLISRLLALNLLETFTETLKIDDLDLREKIFESLDAFFSHSPAAVERVTQTSLKMELQTWISQSSLEPENKQQFAKILTKVGVSPK
jgi:hypothetical protein